MGWAMQPDLVSGYRAIMDPNPVIGLGGTFADSGGPGSAFGDVGVLGRCHSVSPSCIVRFS